MGSLWRILKVNWFGKLEKCVWDLISKGYGKMDKVKEKKILFIMLLKNFDDDFEEVKLYVKD